MLKSLELVGFKSFADRTTFDFSEGITAVVGPNGSGKSNVVDGIKWILGDQSAKSLRGKEMTDVIFNGTRSRSAGGMAEATLTFDNSSGFLPMELQEVQIGRRLWRSGDSEYLINRSAVRLKDVRRLLTGTGAGSAAYSIIEQGRVDQILQSNSVSRRAIFEEAAGISLFKARRLEFLRRMERVDQLLARLTDIVDEVESQLNSLRNQAEKASRFRELSTELRTAWLGLAADDYRDLSSQCSHNEGQIQEWATRVELLNSQREDVEKRLGELDGRITLVDEQIHSIQRQSSTIRESIAGQLATLELQTSRRKELTAEVIRLRRQSLLMDRRFREQNGELQQDEALCEEREREFRRLESVLFDYNTQIGEMIDTLKNERDGIEEKENQVQQQTRRIDADKTQLQQLQTQRQATVTAEKSTRDRRREFAEQIRRLDGDCEQSQEKLDTARQKLADAEKTLSAAQQQRETFLTDLSEFRDTLAGMREERSGRLARQAVLEDLENQQEGLGIGVREILRRAKTSNYPPWNSILGSVADLIDVDLEQAALLDAALGHRAQFLVIRRLDSLIEYLNGNSAEISGRVGFLQCDRPEDRDANSTRVDGESSIDADIDESADRIVLLPGDDQPDLTQQPGVVMRADELAKPAKNLPQLAADVLADTWIVESLQVAFALSRQQGRGCRFVTLQGELLETNGTLIVGTPRAETALVSRKSELRKLKTDLAKLDRQITAEEQRLSQLNGELSSVDTEIGQCQTARDGAADLHRDIRSEQQGRMRERKQRQDEWEAAGEELDSLAAVARQFAGEIEEREMKLATAEEDLRNLTTAVESGEREVSQLEHRLQLLRGRHATEQLDLAKQKERLHAVTAAAEKLRAESQQRRLQREEALRRFLLVREKRELIERSLLETRSILAEQYLADEHCLRDADEWFAEKDELRGKRTGLAAEETASRHDERELKDRRHQEEISLQDARNKLETLAGRIEEEYQVDLADIVSAGVSAWRSHTEKLREKMPSHTPEEQDDEKDSESERPTEPPPAGAETEVETETDADVETDAETVVEAGQETAVVDEPSIRFEDVRPQIEAKVNRLRRKLKTMGSVNTDSLQNLDDLESRYARLSATLSDLLEAKSHLEGLVRRIDVRCKELFSTTFDAVRENFRELFRKAFGGGDGDILLEDPDNALECGIEIVARPPGKKLKSISLMSGGEKTLTAFALLLAIFRFRPSPYCVLDEVDAALDEANVERLLAMLEEFKQSTQFVIITHKKPTMTIADVLYGVTMEEAGVSKRLTVQFENIGENGEFLGNDDHDVAA